MKRNLQKFMGAVVFLFLLTSCSSSNSPSSPSSKQKDELETSGKHPQLKSVTIAPEEPTASDTLNLIVETKGNEKDLTLRYQWFVNGKPLPGEVQSDLRSGSYVRGDLVTCKVQPSSGVFDGATMESEAVEIVNTPPTLSAIGTQPERPGRNSGIDLVFEADDFDGDPLEIQVRWFLQRKEIPEANDTHLEGEALTKNLYLWAKIEVNDNSGGIVKGETKKIVISNSPPQILSSPPELSSPTSVYIYQVEAEDADGDPLTYSVTGPSGINISSSGKLTWKPSLKDKGFNKIRVTVKDDEGASAYQEFEMNLSFKEVTSPQSTP